MSGQECPNEVDTGMRTFVLNVTDRGIVHKAYERQILLYNTQVFRI